MEKAKIGAIALAVGALFILVATLTSSWFSESKGKRSIGIGLWSVEFCRGDKCKSESMSTDDMKDDKMFVYVGKLTFFVGLATAGLLGFLAFCGFTQKKEFITKFAKFGLIDAAVFLVLAIVFLLTKPEGFDKIGVGFSFIIAFLGGIAGIVGSKFVQD